MLPITQRPKMAEIVVSRDPSNPIHPPSGDGRRFSGRSPVAQNVTAYNSNGNWNCRHQSFSFLREYRSVPAQASPKKNAAPASQKRSEEHTSELQSRFDLVCRLLLEKKK